MRPSRPICFQTASAYRCPALSQAQDKYAQPTRLFSDGLIQMQEAV